MAYHRYSNCLILTMTTPTDARNATKHACERVKTQPRAGGLNSKIKKFGLCAYQFDQHEDGCTFHVMVLDINALDQLARDVIRDDLEKVLNGWLGDQVQGPMNLEIRLEDIQRMRPFFELEPSKVKVSYAYCPGLQQWYWSPDLQLWHCEDLLVVQAGDLQCQRLDKADLERLAKLKMIKENPKPGVQCPICFLKTVRPGNVFEGRDVADATSPEMIQNQKGELPPTGDAARRTLVLQKQPHPQPEMTSMPNGVTDPHRHHVRSSNDACKPRARGSAQECRERPCVSKTINTKQRGNQLQTIWQWVMTICRWISVIVLSIVPVINYVRQALSANKVDEAVHDVRLPRRCSFSETPNTAVRVPPG